MIESTYKWRSTHAGRHAVADSSERAVWRRVRISRGALCRMVVLMAVLFPTAAWANWGQDWGEMYWGAKLVPVMSRPGIAALVIGMLLTVWFVFARRARAAG